jgi:hypothetical protein
MTRSSEEIEREVEATRGDLDRTVEALKEKMTPGQLVDEVMDAMGGPVQEMAANLGAQVRANPLPLALIGAGVAWLIFGRGSSSSYHEERSFRSRRLLDRDLADFEPDYEAGPESGYLAGDGDTGEGRMDRMKDAARGGADKARRAISSAKYTAAQKTQTARRRASELADTARERAGEYAQRGRDAYMDTLDREPLIVGAVGFAVGAAIGAAIPSTPLEDRYVGPLRDRALDEGRSRAKQGLEQAKDVAKKTVDSVREEANRQGVTNLSGLVDKAEQVARAGVDTVKREVETRTH